MKLLRAIQILFLSLNLLAVVCLLLAYLSRYLSPAETPSLALFGLLYPVWLVCNILCIAAWIFTRKRKLAWISVLVILLGWASHLRFWNPFGGGEHVETREEVRVLTYNVRLFDVYHDLKAPRSKEKIFDVLDREKADVYCFQEFYKSDENAAYDTRSELKKRLGINQMHEAYVSDVTGKQHFGVAMFSRLPMISKGEVDLVSDKINRCIYADLKSGNDTIRVYTMHLASIRFKKADYDFISRREEGLWDGGQRLSSRLMDAFERRAAQVEAIKAHIKASPYPVVIAGDMNDTPVSYSYREFEQFLQDGFMNAGAGLGRTYVGTFPSFRIDYVWHSEDLVCQEFHVLSDELSDHRPVVAVVGVPEVAKQ